MTPPISRQLNSKITELEFPDPSLSKSNLEAAATRIAEQGSAQISVEDLFELAKECVSQGLYAQRDALYNCIKSDTRTTKEQYNTVAINDGMKLRREGQYDTALETLEAIAPHSDPETEWTRCKEISLCQFYIWEQGERIDSAMIQKSVQTAQAILDSDFYEELPAAVHIEVIHLVAGNMLEGNFPVETIEPFVRLYENAVHEVEKQTPVPHHQAGLAWIKGGVAHKKEEFNAAINHYTEAIKLNEVIGHKFPPTIQALLVLDKMEQLDERQKALQSTLTDFIEKETPGLAHDLAPQLKIQLEELAKAYPQLAGTISARLKES